MGNDAPAAGGIIVQFPKKRISARFSSYMKRYGSLYILPVLTLLSVNFHSSFWVMHYVLFLPYLVPYPVRENGGVADAHIRLREWKHLLIPMLLMTGSLFLNPYGIDNITYVFKGLKVGVADLGIVELYHTGIISPHSGIPVVIGFIFLSVLVVKKRMNSVTLFMALGFFALGAYQASWSRFLTIPYLYLLNTAVGEKQPVTVKESGLFERKAVLALTAFLLSALFILAGAGHMEQMTLAESWHLDKVASLMKEADPDGNFYCSFNTASYMEFAGLKVLYDARPELYDPDFNRGPDVMEAIRIFSIGRDNEDNTAVDEEDVKSAIKRYKVEYVVLEKKSTAYLQMREFLEKPYYDKDDIVFAAVRKGLP